MRYRQYIFWYFRNFKFELEYGDVNLYKGLAKGYSIDEREGCITIYNFKQLSDMCMNESGGRIKFSTEKDKDIGRISSWYPGRDNDYIYLSIYQFNKEIGQYEL